MCPNALTRFTAERKESASVGVWCQEALAEGALYFRAFIQCNRGHFAFSNLKMSMSHVVQNSVVVFLN